jgi:two-component system response regulator HydG
VNLPHQFEPVDAGHLDVRENEVDRLARDDFERRRGIARRGDVVANAGEDALEGAAVELLIIDDEDVGFSQWNCLRVAEGGRSILESRAEPFKRPDSETDKTAMAPSSAGSADDHDHCHFSPDETGFVLLVDDEPLLLRSLKRILERAGFETALAETVAEAEPFLTDPRLDAVLVDLLLGSSSGLQLLERMKSLRPEVEVIVMTGHGSIESAVGCIRRGAFDYLEKPFDDVHRIQTTVRKAIERRSLMRRNRELEEELRARASIPQLVGKSPAMRALASKVHSLRHNESHVLIQGESGTGKELVAYAIHSSSPRASGDFVPVDCGALPETIIESELFGHEKGAFTGAVGAPGLFRIANRGTLFLDEIGEIPPHVQAKLLRALQHKEVRPVGAATSVPIDIRVISATHRDLATMVDEGGFRTDLFYRLNVVRVVIPPLRERREDIPLLVHHFLRKHGDENSRIEGIEERALELLIASDWPGNVRELENTIESAMALAPGPRLRVSDLAINRPACRSVSVAVPPDLPISLDAYERCALERALAECAGDVSAAARVLGVGRSTLYRKLAKHDIVAGGRSQPEFASTASTSDRYGVGREG